jgi:PBSX family phage terminase large subunit
MLWQLTDKQNEMQEIINEHKYTLCIGQGRSGKSLVIMVEMFRNAIKYPNTNQAVFRNTLAAVTDGIFKITIPEVIKNFFPALPMMEGFNINLTKNQITFPNGSTIVCKGLDNSEKVQKLLSTQFSCVFFDECHLIEYEHFGLLMTRMPQPLDVDYKVKVICAANWAPVTHWLKTFFEDGLNPETKAPHNQDVEIITSTTDDNTTINAEEYIQTLENAGDRRSRLACAGTGFYETIDGALWEQGDIKRGALEIDEYDDIIIAFDPATTNSKTSDEHGVCIAGIKDDNYYVIECYEKKEDVNKIAEEVCKLYHQYQCSRLVIEVNNGGDFIPALVNTYDKEVYCESVRATRGKLLRAEPVASQYKNGLVYHEKEFRELESQMLTYSGKGDSPNCMDALVWAITYLSQNNTWIDVNAI